MPDLDDATVAYILEARRSFEELRQIAAQLAGLLVLEASGARSELPHHPMLAAAEELHREASERVRQARVTVRAERHHHAMLDAGVEIDRALRAAKRSLAIDPILIPLRAAYRSLQDATHRLPGFEMVALGQGCCGAARRNP